MYSPKGLARARESSIVDVNKYLMLAEPAHWCSGLGTPLLNERARGRIPVDALFFSLIFSKFNSRGQRSLPVQEASQVGNRYRCSSNVEKKKKNTWLLPDRSGFGYAGVYHVMHAPCVRVLN